MTFMVLIVIRMMMIMVMIMIMIMKMVYGDDSNDYGDNYDEDDHGNGLW